MDARHDGRDIRFFWSPDDKLAMRMRRGLVHRGGEGHQIASTLTGTIGYLARFSQSQRNRLSFQIPSRLKLAGGVEKVIIKTSGRDFHPKDGIESAKGKKTV